MSANVLVAYATRSGSTQGVAEAIGHALSAVNIPVEVLPVGEVASVSLYRAVVVGSAIQEGQWLPEAFDFVRRHQDALRERPFAAFLVCMTMAMENDTSRQAVRDWMAPVRRLVTPVSEGYFSGAFDLDKVPSFTRRLAFRVSMMAGVWPDGDRRDWAAIETWGRDLAATLGARSS